LVVGTRFFFLNCEEIHYISSSSLDGYH